MSHKMLPTVFNNAKSVKTNYNALVHKKTNFMSSFVYITGQYLP